MNYLGKHLNNSSILPYDIMAQVQQYADPLFAIRNQIENKDYDLDEIMYQRMKTYIKQMPFVRISYELNHKEYGKKLIKIKLNNSNIDNRAYKDAILNYHCGYKNLFLWRHKRFPSICGLEPNFPNEYNYQLGKFIEINGGSASNKNIQQLYKEWLLIGH